MRPSGGTDGADRPQLHPHHCRHDAGRSHWILRRHHRADAGHGRPRRARRALRQRLCDGADHAALPRQHPDGPLPARSRRPAQRDAGRSRRSRRSPKRCRKQGFATAAFVGAFPLDRRFGLNRGFGTYGDQMPRSADGRPSNERPGSSVVDEALAWLAANRGGRFFLWVHLFEPHAPYGDARSGAPAAVRYGEEIAEADRQTGRLLTALGEATASTLIALTSDHGEAFGEHGEIAHSIFVYDTTLRVPWILAGPGVQAGVVDAPVSLVDLAPTAMALLGTKPFDADGIALTSVLRGRGRRGSRPLRRVVRAVARLWMEPAARPSARADGNTSPPRNRSSITSRRTATESRNAVVDASDRAKALSRRRRSLFERPARRVRHRRIAKPRRAFSRSDMSPGGRHPRPGPIPRTARRWRRGSHRSRLANCTAPALEGLLREILAEEPGNPLANLRLGTCSSNQDDARTRCRSSETAIDARYPSADAHLGLAGCQAARAKRNAAAATLRAADVGRTGQSCRARQSRADALRRRTSRREAIDPLQRALSVAP